MIHESFMRRAIALAEEKMHQGAGGPFGAVLVLQDKVIAEGWNQVTSANDPTAHAEIVALREACRRLNRFSLAGATLYTSCEPCPMCMAAIYWARIDQVFFGNSRSDAAAIGFDDALIYDELAKPIGARLVRMSSLLADEAQRSFIAWRTLPGKTPY